MSNELFSKQLKILVLEDNLGDVKLIEYHLKNAQMSFNLIHVDNKNEFIHELEDFIPDIILVDYTVPGFSGMQALSLVKELAPMIPVIFVTGTIDEESAVECMKAGAIDYVLKNSLQKISISIKCALEKIRINKDKKELEEKLFFALNTLESIPDAVFVVNMQSKVIYWNMSAEDIFGYSNQEMINKSLIFFESDSRKEAFLLKLNTLTDKKEYSSDERCFNKSKEVFCACIKSKILLDRSGKMIGFVCNAYTIEDKRQKEDYLIDYKTKSEKIFSHLPDIILLTNKELDLIDLRVPDNLNEIILKEKLINKNIGKISESYKIISKELISQISYYILLTLKNKYLQSFEHKLISHNNIYNFELRFILVPDEQVMIVIKDITHQQVEKINPTIEGNISHSLDGKILNISENLVKILGYNSEKEILDNVKITCFYLSNVYDKIINNLILNEIVNNFQTRFIKKDGNEILVNINAILIKDTLKNVIYFELMIKCHLDELNQDEQTKSIQKLESISNMITSIAYEFNNLISSLEMSLYILENEITENTSLKHNLDNIKTYIGQVSETSSKLLNFNQIIKN